MRIVKISVDVMTQLDYKSRKISLEEILTDLSRSVKVPEGAIASKYRKDTLSICRQIFSYVCVRYGRYHLNEIAAQIGGKHHSSIIVANRVADKHIKTGDEKFGTIWTMYIANSKVWPKILSDE